MIYIHRMQNLLSSNLAFVALFRFDSPPDTYTLALETGPSNEKEIPPRFYVDGIARRPSLHRHYGVNGVSGFSRNDAARICGKGYEQHAANRNGVAIIPQRQGIRCSATNPPSAGDGDRRKPGDLPRLHRYPKSFPIAF